MGTPFRRGAVVAFVTLAIGGLSTPVTVAAAPQATQGPAAAEAVPGVAPPGAAKTAVYRDAAGRKIPAPATGTEAELLACTPVSGRDNPHRSSTGVAVSGHGWWDKGNCSKNRANVYNCLYEWYTDNSWRRKACSPKKELKPGGGSTNRTVARHDCANTQRTSWRNHVDVDVIGEGDTGEWPMRQADVNCRVY